MARRVVVTGLGLISPLGLDSHSTWEGLVSGRSGVSGITRFDASNFGVRIAGEVFNPEAYGVVLQRGSTLREEVNRSILRLREDGSYSALIQKWFGG